MENILSKASFKSKESKKLPTGAKILSKETSVEVEQIENGYLVIKRCEVKYEANKRIDWDYSTTKYFSKDNPLDIDLEGLKDKKLSDNFD